MIARLFNRGVVLHIGARVISASSVPDLRGALIGHTAVSAARISELGKRLDGELAAQAAGLAALTANLSDALGRRDCDPATVLASVYTAKASLDENWANCIAQASEWPHVQSAYQRALLDALLEYLASERDCVRTLVENRQRTQPDHSRPVAVDSEMLLHQRLIFDVAHDDDATAEAVQFNRLTKGEPLEMPIAPGQCVQLMFAHYRFALICGSPWRLVDEYGEDLRLSPERCIAGRSSACDLIIHDRFRAISRRHVVLETQSTELLRITDISSLGTFVPRVYLDNRLH